MAVSLRGEAQLRSPWGVAAGPQVVERDRVLVGVHAGPEALVAVGGELAVGRQALERLALEHRVLAEVLQRARSQREEAAVDPVLGLRLLVEAGDAVVVAEQRD